MAKNIRSGPTLFVAALASGFWIFLLAIMVFQTDPCVDAAHLDDFIENSFNRFLSCRTANELGDFLAGAFAPLAFLWLVGSNEGNGYRTAI